MDTKTLQELGLNKNEIEVYLELNKHEEIIASQLAKKLKIQRPNVYDTLQKLIEKGLAKYFLKSGKRYFQPTKPEKLFDFFARKKKNLEKKEKNVKQIIKELNSFRPKPSKNYSVSILEGIEGMKSNLMDAINEAIKTGNKEHLGIRLNLEKLYEIDEITGDKFFNLKNKHKIKTRFLVLENTPFQKKTAIEFRVLPKKYLSPTNIYIYGNKVSIWLWPETPAIIVIENKDTADSYRSQFEIMWKNAKPLKN